MEQYYVTVGSEGEIEIPVTICESLGIVDGTRLGVRIEGGLLILTPDTPTVKQRAFEE